MKRDAQRYLRQGLAKGDQVSLFGFFAGQVLKFTNDPAKISGQIEHMQPRIQPQKQITAEETLGQVDAIIRYLGKLPGDRMLLLVSRQLASDHYYQNDLIAHAFARQGNHQLHRHERFDRHHIR